MITADPTVPDLLDPADPPEVQRARLIEIVQALMARVERETEGHDLAYAQFQRAVLLEDQVRDRTRDLEQALDLLNLSNARLAEANREIEAARQNLANAIETVQEGFALFDARGKAPQRRAQQQGGDVPKAHPARFQGVADQIHDAVAGNHRPVKIEYCKAFRGIWHMFLL